MIIFSCNHCQAQLAFWDQWGGQKALCPHCRQFVQVPAQGEEEKGVKVSKSSFSATLQQFVKTRVEDIDDDPTDNKFLVPEEHRGKQESKLRKFLQLRVEDIDDDPTDNKFLQVEETTSSLPPSIHKMLKGKKKQTEN